MITRARSRILALALGFACPLLNLLASNDPALDWGAIVALDAGPKTRPATQQEARSVAVAHLARQEKALRSFLAEHGGDEHAFEAKMRLARVLQLRAGMEESEAPRKEAKRLLDELAASVPAEKRVEVDFAQIAFQMRAMRTGSPAEREQLLATTRRFQAAHPDDRRLPQLLAEVAVLFDAEPETKKSLLLGAQSLAQDEELKHRISDDLLRLDWLGKPVSLHCTTLGGKEIKLEESRGKVVLLVFFADWSPPSIEAVTKIQRAIEAIPKERLQVLGISLDNKQEELADAISKHSISWQIGFDGKGWASPLVRSLGINTLPTVWLLDQQGRLRSLNALEGTADQIWRLIRKPPTAE